MLAVLIGSLPAEGPTALARLELPFILLADPIDDPPTHLPGAVQVLSVPFKSDPLGVLQAPLPRGIGAVFSFTELGQLPAALLAEALDVPTVPVAAVLKTRNKLHMRWACAGRMQQPSFGLVGSVSPEGGAFPVIVKPVDGSGSRGVEYAADAPAYARRAAMRSACLWEQFLEGREFSVEAVTWKPGVHQVLGITEKITTGPPRFVEVGHFAPARLAPAEAERIRGATVECLDLLGITMGASHTEVKLTRGQAFVVETHTRAGGDRIPFITQLVSGRDQYDLAVRSVLGLDPVADQPPRFRCAAVHYFRWPDGIVAAIDGREEAFREIPGLIELEIRVRAGQPMPGWQHSHDRPGFVVVGGAGAADIEERIAAAQAQLRVTYQ